MTYNETSKGSSSLTEMDKGSSSFDERGINESGWLINGWLVFGWLLSYIPLYNAISKLTSNWNKVE